MIPPSTGSLVVGGGISGLFIAQVLTTKHGAVVPNVIVTEARNRAVGNIITAEKDDFLWEEGPNSFQPSDPMLTMVVDSGLKDDLVLGDPDAPRFVLWDGKLPGKPNDLPFFDLMSIRGKIRAGFVLDFGLLHHQDARNLLKSLFGETLAMRSFNG